GAGCCHLQCLLSGNGLSLRADGYGRKSWVYEKSLTANPDAEQQKHRESGDQRVLPVKITHNENPATKGESARIVDPTAHKIVAEEIRRQLDTVPTCATALLVGRTEVDRVLAEENVVRRRYMRGPPVLQRARF